MVGQGNDSSESVACEVAKKMLQRTDSMIPEPTGVDTHGVAPECVGTFMSMTWDEVAHKPPPDSLLKHVRFFCESQAMKDFCERAGLHGCSFEWNPASDHGARYFRRHTNVSTTMWSSYTSNLKRILHLPGSFSHQQYSRFWDAYENDPDVNRLAVVFHGTPEDCIPKILKDGLDPRYRRTQAFGKGEYFSKDPGLATTYCKGGHKLVVYLVFVPEEHERYYSQKDRDIVVVKNLSHEVPIGVLTFDSVDRKVVEHTQELRMEQKALKVEAIEKEKRLKQAREEGAEDSMIQKLEDEVQAAWDEYFRTKLDENRNLMEHLHLPPVALHH